jgi:hypothetical protein
MLGATYALIALLIMPFFLLFGAIAGVAAKAGGGQAFPAAFGLGAIFIVLLPILYGVMGFIGGIIAALIYNLVAKWIGGIEVDVA